jgi:hypothetical protein
MFNPTQIVDLMIVANEALKDWEFAERMRAQLGMSPNQMEDFKFQIARKLEADEKQPLNSEK